MVRKVSDHIYLIDTVALGLEEFVAAYLITGSSENALVDTGYASSLSNIVEELRQVGLRLHEIKYIIPTHLHLDHSGAASHIIKNSSKSLILCHPRAVKHFIDPSRLIASVREIYGESAALFGEVIPVPLENIRGVHEYEKLELGDVTLRFIHAPGHAPHQIVVYVEEDQALITGDAVSIQYPSSPVKIPTTPPPSYNHAETLETLEKLSKISSKIILRPHFGETPYTLNYFKEEVEILQNWRDRIRAFIEQGLTLDEIIESLLEEYDQRYRGLLRTLPSLHTTVRLSVLGMMKYLEEER
ncbi:MAG: MBL fold metallo-hydrolase [Aigarchaeota archaeon]|nr:MBL fold metallo-hydrolase [Aigarchaeota archaeon]MCX8192236.1 MBL fold metallo-hydrolase [Nitrososphaeria archaeon]MDW7986156.1 MBL fold metallo-hydrolase [Nitrososphaerota archaeon]